MARSLAFLGVVLLILSTDAFALFASLGSAKTPEEEVAKRTDTQRNTIQSKAEKQAAAKKAGQAHDDERQIDDARELYKRAFELYKAGRYSEAIPLVQRSLATREKALGPNHPDVGASLDILAALYEAQGRYDDAEPLYKRSLAIFEESFGPDDREVAGSLNNLAELYREEYRYREAEPLYKRSLAISEKALGPNHPAVARTLSNLGLLLSAQGRYADAEPLYKRSLAIKEKAFGPDHPEVANILNNLAVLRKAQGRYADAEPLYKRSLAINEKALGPDHPEVAKILNNLAVLREAQGRYADAEPLYKRSLAINEKAFGPDHPKVGDSLNNLAALYSSEGRYDDAEPLYNRSLAINEKAFGPDHPEVGGSLNNLGELYRTQGRYADAEPMLKRSLAIKEKTLGPDHRDVAQSLNNLAGLYLAQSRYGDAEPLFKRSLAINERALGSNHPEVAQSLAGLATLYDHQGRYSDAEPLYKRSLAILEKALGPDHPEVAGLLNNIAVLFDNQGRYADAEPLLKRSLAIKEKTLGPDHPAVAGALGNLAHLLDKQGRYAEEEALQRRSLAINERALGPDHPNVALSLNNLAELYRDQGRYADAEPLYRRSLAINEKALGLNHPDVANSLKNIAVLYQKQGRYTDAEPLLQRSLAIFEKALGPDHRDVAHSLEDLTLLYQAEARYADAEQLFKRSLAIEEKAFGPNHPDVSLSLNNLAGLYAIQDRYADALPIVKRTIAQNDFATSIALPVLYGAQKNNLISLQEAIQTSYILVQRASSSPAASALSMLASRFAAGSNDTAQLVRKDQDLTAEGDKLDKNAMDAVSKPPSERNVAVEKQTRKRIEEIRFERQKLQDVLNQRFPDYVALSHPQPLGVRETGNLLSKDEAIIVLHLAAKCYIWVITQEKVGWEQLAASADDISKEVATLRAALDPESPKPYDPALAHHLYTEVLGPIEDGISDKTRLSFVLSGALTSLPPQLLIRSDPAGKSLASVDWLVRKYAITVLPSVASLKVLRSKSSTSAAIKPMIGYGDPIFDRTVQNTARKKVASLNRSLPEFYRGVIANTKSLAEALPPLPETADELRAVAKELGAKTEEIKLGESASVTNVKHARLDEYRVVYFATHALVAGEVEKFAKAKAEPAIVLSIPEKPTNEDDGLLRASDVAMLKMNADFVVLSACNTAAGDKPGAEALSGLARAFFYAGARSLIVSNWEVDSDSTVALLTGLFDALKSNPRLSHAEALRASMLRMIANTSKPEWVQPKFWAPFVVVGEPQKQ